MHPHRKQCISNAWNVTQLHCLKRRCASIMQPAGASKPTPYTAPFWMWTHHIRMYITSQFSFIVIDVCMCVCCLARANWCVSVSYSSVVSSIRLPHTTTRYNNNNNINFIFPKRQIRGATADGWSEMRNVYLSIWCIKFTLVRVKLLGQTCKQNKLEQPSEFVHEIIRLLKFTALRYAWVFILSLVFFSLHFFRIAVFSVCRLCDCGAIEVIGEKKLCIRLLWAPPIGSRFVRVHPICVFLPWRFEDICEKHSKQFETIWLFFLAA